MKAMLIFQSIELGEELHPFAKMEIEYFVSKYDDVYLVCFSPGSPLLELNKYKNLHIVSKPVSLFKRNYKGLFSWLTRTGIEDVKLAKKIKCPWKYYIKQTAKVLMFGNLLGHLANSVVDTKPDEKWIIEAYWLSGPAYAAALVKQKHPNVFAFSRSHSSETDIERNPAAPCMFKNYIYKQLDKIFFVSDWGRDSFVNCIMPLYGMKICEKAQTLRLGTSKKDESFNPSSTDDLFRIFTCSRLVPLKRLDLLAAALSLWDGKQNIEWTHFGGGDLMESIKLAVGNNQKVKFICPGMVANEGVHKYLADNPIDVFVNVSKFEGLPVSIMEAMSYGIPIIATDAGGTKELVDSSNGILLKNDLSAGDLLEAIKKIVKLLSSDAEKEQMRKSSFDKWNTLCNQEKNYQQLFLELSEY